MADKASIVCYKKPSDQRRINLQSIQEFYSNVVPSENQSDVLKENINTDTHNKKFPSC
jgi:hypothetical protein